MSLKYSNIWFDFSNPPHVNLFRPFIRVFKNEGIKAHCTTREFVETTGLLDKYNIPYDSFGKHGGKNRVSKLFNLLLRNYKLYNSLPDFDYNISSSFEAAQVSWLKRKPAIFFDDNEIAPNWLYSKFIKNVFIPVYIDKKLFIKQGVNKDKIIQYDGYKEDIYIADYIPDENFRKIVPFEKFVTLRPENIQASYVPLNTKSIVPLLIESLIKNGYNILYLPRYKKDIEYVDNHPQIFIPESPLNGLDVCYYSDVVLTGAGTFAREAAILGTPAVSFFAGNKLLSVDQSMVDKEMIYYSRNVNQIMEYIKSSNKSSFEIEKSKFVQNQVVEKLKNIIFN